MNLGRATFKALKALSKVIRLCRLFSDTVVNTRPVSKSPEGIALLAHHDANHGLDPKGGMTCGIISSESVTPLAQGKAPGFTPCSMIFWRSHRIRRDASSSFVAEVLGAKSAFDMALLLQRLIGELIAARAGYGVPAICQIDCSSAVECVHTEVPHTSGKRLLGDIIQTRDAMEGGHAVDLTWRSETIQVSDALTKHMCGELLRNVIVSNWRPRRPLKETKRERGERRRKKRQEQGAEQPRMQYELSDCMV